MKACEQKQHQSMIGLFFSLALLLLPPAISRGWGQTDRQKEWEKVLAAAEKEGQVDIAGPRGDAHRQALTDMFQKKYPRIRVAYIGASTRDHIPRITREREAGIFNWDIYMDGPTVAFPALKAVGTFDPLQAELVSSEVLDDSKWHEGFSTGFIDTSGRLYYAFEATASKAIVVNWDVVSAKEFKSFKDTLSRKWAGKITWLDPRYEGDGLDAALLFYLSYGEESLRMLFREQKIIFTRDWAQITEWLAQGRYPIAVTTIRSSHLKTFQDKGVGRNVKPLEDPTMSHSIVAYFGAFGVVNRRPHPNATKVYVNWLLSKEGQTGWVTHVRRNSRRLDVPLGNPNSAVESNKKYIWTETEKMIPKREVVMRLAREAIPQ